MIAMVLLIATLVTAVVPMIASCNNESKKTQPTTNKPTEPTDPEDKPDEPDEPVRDPDIPDELNLALQIDKLPVATKDMTEEELREVVIAFMYLQLNFAYKADLSGYGLDEYGYYIKNLYSAYNASENLDNIKIKFEDGKYYGGMPYMGNTAGSVYRWLEFYDPDTGVMDWSPIIRTDRKNWVDSEKNKTYPNVGSSYFGNTCASSCVWAWLRVSDSIRTFWTNTWLPSNGYVQVGDYELSANGDHDTSTNKICTKNGRKKMYDCYAQMKKADGLVQTGHAVMAISDAVVVYNDDGSINPTESYLLIAEQKASFLSASPLKGGVDLYSPLNESKGLTYRIMGNYAGNVVNDKVKEMKWTFDYLYTEGYLPFTIPELVGQDDVEEVDIKFNTQATGDTITLAQLKSSNITCNYPISDVHVTLIDKEGNQVFTGMYAEGATNIIDLKNVRVTDVLTNNAIYASKDYIEEGLLEYGFSKYTIEISCRVSTGELITIYTGTFKKS